MSKGTCLAVVLAAGEGTRMKSRLPKVLHGVAGRPLVAHVLYAVKDAAVERAAVVVGPDRKDVAAEAGRVFPEAGCYEQRERLGTAHAVLAAREALAEPVDEVLVLFGDTPLVRAETLNEMRAALRDGAAVAVLGFHAADPTGYGRLIVKDGALLAIREHNDASAEERAITLCNAGIMALSGAQALSLLEAVGNANAKGEYYLTDVVEIARARGLKTVALEADEAEVQGINTRVQLAEVEASLQKRLRTAAMMGGVTLVAPETVFFSADTRLAPDVVVEPHVVFGPGVMVESDAVIHAFSHLEGAHVAAGASVGPYARLRPGTRLGAGARAGNFVEIKNADILDGAKINHLSYIGDAEVGERANIGAGTITCNYDGVSKHKTVIGDDAFIGSNSALVAPVRIGQGAYVGSGSVIVEDVPAEALAVARGRQVVKEGWARGRK